MKTHSKMMMVMALSLTVFSCTNRDQEKMSRNAERAGDNVERKTDNLGERIETGAEKVGDSVANTANKVGNSIENGAERVGNSFDRNTEMAKLDRSEVTQIQEKLFSLGYLKTRANGNMDDSTRSALRDFQRAKSLAVTGEVNGQTLDSLGLSRSLAE